MKHAQFTFWVSWVISTLVLVSLRCVLTC